jgi:hypothetical protein
VAVKIPVPTSGEIARSANDDVRLDYLAAAASHVDEIEAECQIGDANTFDYVEYAEYIELSLQLDPSASGWDPQNVSYWRAVSHKLLQRSIWVGGSGEARSAAQVVTIMT